MISTPLHPPFRSNIPVPGEFEPGTAPVEPDVGPVPPFMPDDPKLDRIGDPPAHPAPEAQRVPGLCGPAR